MGLLNGKGKQQNFHEPSCPIAKMVCPRNNDPQAGTYCPAWTEYVQTNVQTGEERIVKQCVFQAIPHFMIETLMASNRPAAAMETTRNELAKGFSEISRQMQLLPSVLHFRDPDAIDVDRTQLIATDQADGSDDGKSEQ